MPELPDLTVYVEAIKARVLGQPLQRVRLGNPFLLRTADPPISAAEGRQVLTSRLTEQESIHLFEATRAVLSEWIDRLRREAVGGFPEKVTAFRKEMAVHGRYRLPCPDCGAPIQRIVHAENETNYCPRCQTGGRILSDRSLARLLKSDWPKTLEELERNQTLRGR